jgi:hypothetical protein
MPASARPVLIHVTDREGDSFELIADLLAINGRFVIRSKEKDRLLFDETKPYRDKNVEKLSSATKRAAVICERMVPLSRRNPQVFAQQRKINPPRASRVARLRFSATSVSIRRPANASASLPHSLTINVVRVFEVEAPNGVQPVEWVLLTTEPVTTDEEILRVVDIYRARWTIEEYFKALKSGCAYEQRQLESLHGLLNALALFVPIAWRLLLLRNLARDTPNQSAKTALTDAQVEVLVALSKGRLSRKPTLEQAMDAVAALGGHIRNNGQPGWQVLGRGFHDLLIAERVWCAAKEAQRSDQS